MRRTVEIRAKVTCPNCWHLFPPEDALWIAEHPDLLGDPRLGSDFPERFLPSRFNVNCQAIDLNGFPCSRLACPKCHLDVPRAMLEVAPAFFSILGAPASGKSYFLASMTWRLRKVLAQFFQLSLSDADAVANDRINRYVELQFMGGGMDTPVAIEKTELHGDFYHNVDFSGRTVTYIQPFLFSLQPLKRHPSYGRTGRIITLYDNAGESFLPGADTSTSPVTRHLALSDCLFFLFDPTQDHRFRELCNGKTADPQMASRVEKTARESNVRQDTILNEAAQRIRLYAGLREDELHDKPLIVSVTKWDCWNFLTPEIDTCLPIVPVNDDPEGPIYALNSTRVREASAIVRSLLFENCPEMVAAAESLCREVLYLPVSATGTSPVLDSESGILGIRPTSISPQWVEVPMLYALSHYVRGLIHHTQGGK